MSVHVEALKALVPNGIAAYDSTVPVKRDTNGKPILPPMPYAVVEAPEPRERALMLDETVKDIDDYFTLRVVGDGIEQARWATGMCRLAFDNAEPDVEGFQARVNLNATSPFIADQDVTLPSGEHPVFSADHYRYRARPTTSGS